MSGKYNTNWLLSEKLSQFSHAILFSNGKLVHIYYRGKKKLKKIKPSFGLIMHLASDPAFPQSSVPVGALLFSLRKNWHCRLPQQIMKYNQFRSASFQQPTEDFFHKWTIRQEAFFPRVFPLGASKVRTRWLPFPQTWQQFMSQFHLFFVDTLFKERTKESLPALKKKKKEESWWNLLLFLN